MGRPRTRAGRAGRTVRLVALALLAATALVAAVHGRGELHRAEATGHRVDAIELQRIVWEVATAQLRETDLAALVASGDTTFTDTELRAATDRREAVRSEAMRRLEALAARTGPTAEHAQVLAERLEAQEELLDGDRLATRWDTLSAFQDEAARSRPAGTETAALAALGEVALVPWYIVSDALDVEYARTRPEVPSWARSYYRRSTPYVASGDAGWLAEDPGDPYRGEWVPRDPVERHLPEAAAALALVFDTAEADRLAGLDSWVRTSSDRAAQRPAAITAITAPPLEVGDALVIADRLGRDLGATVEQALTEATTDATTTAAGQRRWGLVLLATAGISLLLGTATTLIRLRRERGRVEALQEAAETDGLTGLANRRAIQARVVERLADPSRAGHVVLQLDLDRFKSVNDAYGHRVGDELLRAFAGRARGALEAVAAGRDGDHELARIGGDEFLVVLHDSRDPDADADAVVRALTRAFADPLACGPVQVKVELSGGIAVADGPTDLDRLLLEADIALYQAKAVPHTSFERFVEPVLRDILRSFPDRVAAGAVRADLQVQTDLLTGEVVGYEALARWAADGRGEVPAAVWIKAVEQLGGVDLLFAAVARALGGVGLPVAGGVPGPRVWINISPHQLGEPGAGERLLDHLTAAGLHPAGIGVELVETASLADLGLAARNLDRLREAGVGIAIDDFGSGFTPLGHLTALPVDVVKIDRSVVAGVNQRPRQAALIEALVAMTGKLGLTLVAEGIETDAECETLIRLGVTVGQGYLLGRPAPAARVLRDTSAALH